MRRIFFIFIFLFLSVSTFAGSLVAKDGFGELNSEGDFRANSMGLSGVALYDNYNSSLVNPAIITKSEKVIFNFGERVDTFSDIEYKKLPMTEDSLSQVNGLYFNLVFPLPIKNFALGINYFSPINSKLEFSFKQNLKDVDGTDIETTVREKFFKNINIAGIYAGYRLGNLSFAVGPVYVFGNDKAVYYLSDSLYDKSAYNQWEYVYSGYGAKGGIIYLVNNLSFGFSFQSKIKTDLSKSFNEKRVNGFSYSFDYPSKYSFGIAWSKNNFLLSGEYERQNWSQVNYFNNYKFEDSSKISLGGEYTIVLKKKLYRKGRNVTLPLRAGVYWQNGYYKDGKEFAFNMGMGILPFRKSFYARLDLFFSFGKREMKLYNALEGINGEEYKDNFFRFGLSFSLNDKWYKKRK